MKVPPCPDDSPANPLHILGGAALLAAWLLYFAARGLHAGFNVDDLVNMNAHFRHSFGMQLVDNLRYWSTAYRPMGGLFYTILYRVFGFHPFPFRVACFALLGVNLALLYCVCRLLSGSRETAFLAALLATYHAWFVDLYYSTATVYDLLCYSFYFSAFLVYLRIRRTGRPPAWDATLCIAALYCGALNSKEMAASLPAILLVYELVYHLRRDRPANLLRWPLGEGRAVLVTGLMTVPYLAGKLTGPDNLLENPAYRVSISPGRYLDTFHLYLNPILYQSHVFHDSNTVQLVAAMLALAIWRRSRPLLFAWCFVLVSILPVAFMAHYSAFFMYLPMAGWALYAATVLTMIRRALVGAFVRVLSRTATGLRGVTGASQIVLVLALAAFLAPRHRRESLETYRIFSGFQMPVQQTATQLQAVEPHLRKGAHVLFVDDPFPADAYAVDLLARLLYDDTSIQVERTRTHPMPPSEYGQYDSVLVFQDGRWMKR